MKSCLILLAALCVGLGGAFAAAAGHRPAEVAVGYFKQWPTPGLFAQEKKTFDKALGVEVNWVPFDNGNEMSAAVAAGEVQIAYTLGHVPFLVGVSRGLDLTMIGVAVGYAENDNCIVRADAGIDRGNAARLEGRKVAVQTGSVSHYRMLRVLEHLRVDSDKIEILPSAGGAAAADALRRGEVVMACASGSALRSMADLGQPLMSGAEQEEIGLPLFDIVAVNTAFMSEHPQLVQAFMDVVEASNKQWRRNPDPMRAAIARAAQMNRDGSDRTLNRFEFPDADEQKTDAWLGDLVPAYSREIANFFVEQGRLGESLESYDPFITTRFLR